MSGRARESLRPSTSRSNGLRDSIVETVKGAAVVAYARCSVHDRRNRARKRRALTRDVGESRRGECVASGKLLRGPWRTKKGPLRPIRRRSIEPRPWRGNDEHYIQTSSSRWLTRLGCDARPVIRSSHGTEGRKGRAKTENRSPTEEPRRTEKESRLRVEYGRVE